MKLKSNYDMFAERGDDWTADNPAPLTRPAGVSLRLSRAGHIHNLRQSLSSHTVKDSSHVPDNSDTLDDNPDFDRFLAGHCLPITRRLAKERNKVLLPMGNNRGKIDAPRSISPVTNLAAKLRNRRSFHNVKVK